MTRPEEINGWRDGPAGSPGNEPRGRARGLHRKDRPLERQSLTVRGGTGSGLLGLPEDLGDLVDLRKQVVGSLGFHRALGAAGTGELGGLVDQRVQLRVLLEVESEAGRVGQEWVSTCKS